MGTIENMCIEKGQDTGNVLVTDQGKFNPDNFKTHETVFINLLAQMYGVQGKNLKYITDKKSVYRLLKHFLVNTSGWTWFEPYDTRLRQVV
jgi:hypothetical protein